MPQALLDHLDIWTSAVETRSTAGRGSSNKLNLYGIKKLRELILELAVRGQLVPQDPADEPASLLLEKIAAEKARLIKAGKLKQQAALPPIADDEKPFELPDGWEFVRLADIISISSGDGLTSAKMNQDGDIPVFGGNGITGYHDRANISKPTLVIGRVGYYCGSVHVTPDKAWVTDNAFITYISEQNICLEFLYWLLKGTNLKENDNATAQPVISGRKVYPIVVGLPPLPEQHRIVAKVNELMSLCDALEQAQESSINDHQRLVENLLAELVNPTPNSPPSLTRPAALSRRFAPPQGVEWTEEARDSLLLPAPLAGEGLGMGGTPAWARIAAHFDTLFTTEHSIDQLKQTILQLAVMGKLVPQDPTDEPASVLLAKIAAEKARLVKAGKLKKEKPLPPIAEDEKPFELPQGWEWVKLTDILALVTDGDHQPPPKANSGIPFLVIGNLNTGKVVLDGCRFVPLDYYEKLDWGRQPQKNDLLYTVTGSYGIPITVDIEDSFCVQRHVAILKAIESTPTNYLLYLLKAEYAFKYATSVATGIAQKTVPLTGLRKMPIALPPLAEQQRIVAKVDELMTLCDQLKARIGDAQTTQLHLADVLAGQVSAET